MKTCFREYLLRSFWLCCKRPIFLIWPLFYLGFWTVSAEFSILDLLNQERRGFAGDISTSRWVQFPPPSSTAESIDSIAMFLWQLKKEWYKKSTIKQNYAKVLKHIGKNRSINNPDSNELHSWYAHFKWQKEIFRYVRKLLSIPWRFHSPSQETQEQMGGIF